MSFLELHLALTDVPALLAPKDIQVCDWNIAVVTLHGEFADSFPFMLAPAFNQLDNDAGDSPGNTD
jgi:hypothetical protein